MRARALCTCVVLILLALVGPRLGYAQWKLNGVQLSASGDPSGVVSDGAGGSIVLWTEADGVYVQRVDASGVALWTAGGVNLVAPACASAGSPRIAADGAGGAFVVWAQNCSGAVASSEIYAQHVLASGSVDPAWTAANAGNPYGRPACTAASDQIEPEVTPDGAGGVIVAWWDSRDYGVPLNGFTHQYDTYAQRILANGSFAWASNGVPVAVEVNDQRWISLAPDGSGGAVVVWWTAHLVNYGGDFSIFAHHLLSNGTMDGTWPVGGSLLSGGDIASLQRSCPDGTGGMVVTWADMRNGSSNGDVFAQHITPSGVDAGWPVGGQLLCGATNHQAYVAIESDGAGGAIVAWEDDRSGRDIYAHHVLASGALDSGWPSDGLGVVTNALDQVGPPAISTDGAGGAIVSWYDTPGNSIRSMHVLATGSNDPGWPSSGSMVGMGVLSVFSASDGAGGAHVVWWGSVNVQRVYGWGAVADVPRSALGRLDLAVGPNPAPGEALITFVLPSTQQVTVDIYDLAGHLVRTLLPVREMGAGRHQLTWNGENESGMRVRGGLYFVRVNAEGVTARSKISLFR